MRKDLPQCDEKLRGGGQTWSWRAWKSICPTEGGLNKQWLVRAANEKSVSWGECEKGGTYLPTIVRTTGSPTVDRTHPNHTLSLTEVFRPSLPGDWVGGRSARTGNAHLARGGGGGQETRDRSFPGRAIHPKVNRSLATRVTGNGYNAVRTDAVPSGMDPE